MLIVTKRLRIRPVRLSDAEETAKLMTLPVARNLVSWRAPMSVNDARRRIRESRKDAREHGSHYLAISLKETGDLAGWIGVFMPAPRRALQLGFWLGESYQDNGYMTEGLLAALPVAMKRLRKRSIAAECFEDNLASIGVLEHIGMERCGSGLAVSKARSSAFPTIKFSMSQIPAL